MLIDELRLIDRGARGVVMRLGDSLTSPWRGPHQAPFKGRQDNWGVNEASNHGRANVAGDQVERPSGGRSWRRRPVRRARAVLGAGETIRLGRRVSRPGLRKAGRVGVNWRLALALLLNCVAWYAIVRLFGALT